MNLVTNQSQPVTIIEAMGDIAARISNYIVTNQSFFQVCTPEMRLRACIETAKEKNVIGLSDAELEGISGHLLHLHEQKQKAWAVDFAQSTPTLLFFRNSITGEIYTKPVAEIIH